MANTPDGTSAKDDAPTGPASDSAARIAPGSNERPPRRADLIGAWTLESYTLTDDDTGHIGYPLGREAVGMIIYGPDGYMSAQLVDPRHADAADATSTGTDPISSAGLLAYSGSFTVDGTTGLIAHHLLVSSRPDWARTNQHRRGLLDGDRLSLSFTATASDSHRTSTLTWRRLNAQSPR